MAVKTGVKIKENVEELYKLERGFSFLKRLDVLVGIPQETNAGHGGVTNAELLYIHENGSPARNIPPRPVLLEGIREPIARERIKTLLQRGTRLALMGNMAGCEKVYKMAGQIGANAVKAKFGAVGPPLKPATIARKGSSATLIDTGALRNAVTYVVRKK